MSYGGAFGTGGSLTGTGVGGAVETQISEYSSRIIQDAFARLKVSQPVTLFDQKMTYGIPIEYDQLAVNGATITHEPDLSGATLAVTSTAGSRAVLQQAEYSQYQPGNSHEPMLTYGNVNINTGDILNVGYHDDRNGVFIQYYNDGSGQDARVVLRTAISGAPVDIPADRVDWNIDKLDGQGPSGITFNTTGRQIFAADLEWLSVGAAQISLIIDRKRIPIHIFANANTDGSAYMTTADLPCRWELLGGGAGGSSVTAQCCVVQSYGGSQTPSGESYVAETGYVATTQTEEAVMFIRPKATFGGKDNHIRIDIGELSAMSAAESMVIRLRYNATITANNFQDISPTCASEVSSNETWTPGSGEIIVSKPIPASGGGQGSPTSGSVDINDKRPFTLHLDGSLDTITVTVQAVDGSGTGKTFISIPIKEIK